MVRNTGEGSLECKDLAEVAYGTYRFRAEIYGSNPGLGNSIKDSSRKTRSWSFGFQPKGTGAVPVRDTKNMEGTEVGSSNALEKRGTARLIVRCYYFPPEFRRARERGAGSNPVLSAKN